MIALQRFSDVNQRIYLHCASGVRAMLAAQQLQCLGYRQVMALHNTIEQLQPIRL